MFCAAKVRNVVVFALAVMVLLDQVDVVSMRLMPRGEAQEEDDDDAAAAASHTHTTVNTCVTLVQEYLSAVC